MYGMCSANNQCTNAYRLHQARSTLDLAGGVCAEYRVEFLLFTDFIPTGIRARFEEKHKKYTSTRVSGIRYIVLYIYTYQVYTIGLNSIVKGRKTKSPRRHSHFGMREHSFT